MIRWLRILTAVLSAFAAACPQALAEAEFQRHPECKYCGMNREQYAHSRMLVTYSDGTVFASCSLHCVAIDLALNIDKIPKSIQVGDFNSRKLIDAEVAVWVIGGNKLGVMTRRAKWAFANIKDAERFVAANGGVISGFDEALRASYEDMYLDSRMIRDRRKLRNMIRNP